MANDKFAESRLVNTTICLRLVDLVRQCKKNENTFYISQIFNSDGKKIDCIFPCVFWVLFEHKNYIPISSFFWILVHILRNCQFCTVDMKGSWTVKHFSYCIFTQSKQKQEIPNIHTRSGRLTCSPLAVNNSGFFVIIAYNISSTIVNEDFGK